MGKFLLKNINQSNDNAHYSLKIVHNLVVILTILTKYQSKLAILNNKETYHLIFQKNFFLISYLNLALAIIYRESQWHKSEFLSNKCFVFWSCFKEK